MRGALAATLLFFILPSMAAQTPSAPGSEAPFTNRLINSDAPYLLLHAHNPVDWYPWGPEAFAQAKALDKPIFLSVGYSTCFWCHVAERTLYSDPKIAAVMNKLFINIKVDREQRPDVDRAYMLARQLIAGSGGWPNNVFLTPDLQAFYAGSYFPPQRDEHGRPGFIDIMTSVHAAWTDRRADVMASVAQVQSALQRVNDSANNETGQTPIEPVRWINTAISSLLRSFDPLSGGFSPPTSPTKFPQSPVLLLLLAEYEKSNDDSVAQALTQTLDAIAYGGIQDHLAGGFHRYSTTPDWSVPHFEKMLYDNAQLLRVYAQAHAIFGNPLYKHTAINIAHYLRTRMMAPGGGMYTAQDAQVNGVEGASYVWTAKQISAVLGASQAQRFLSVYSLEIVPHSAAAKRAAAQPIETDGAVIRVRQPIQKALDENGYDDIVKLFESLAPARAKLLAQRDQRTAPLRDNKLSVDLNGLAINGFAVAGKALNKPNYIALAKRTAEYMWTTAYDEKKGELFHQVFNGKASGGGFLADYANFARGLVALHTVTGEPIWHQRAQLLTDALLARFAGAQGRLRMTLTANELPVQPQEHGDNESPSGISATIEVLVALNALPGGARYGAAAATILRHHAANVARLPSAWPIILSAMHSPHAQSIVDTANKPAPVNTATLSSKRLTSAAQVEVHTQVDRAHSRILLTLKVKDGFHINANPASLDYLIPTRVAFANVQPTTVTYPKATHFKPSFSQSTLDVYEGETTIIADFKAGALISESELSASIIAQACNDTVCLPPSTMQVAFEQ